MSPFHSIQISFHTHQDGWHMHRKATHENWLTGCDIGVQINILMSLSNPVICSIPAIQSRNKNGEKNPKVNRLMYNVDIWTERIDTCWDNRKTDTCTNTQLQLQCISSPIFLRTASI